MVDPRRRAAACAIGLSASPRVCSLFRSAAGERRQPAHASRAGDDGVTLSLIRRRNYALESWTLLPRDRPR